MKPRFTFIKHIEEANQYDRYTLQLDSHALIVSDVLADFEAFLRGCGYGIDGSIIIEDTDVTES
jgi:hypothetical protein